MKFIYITFYLLLLVSLTLWSCQKEALPPGTEGAPVFSLTASIDGKTMDLAAGKENYYMYTNFGQDSDTIYTFTGALRRENCSGNCGEEIVFDFRDFQKPNYFPPLRLENMFRKGTLDYYFKQPAPYDNVYLVEFFGEVDDPQNFNYYWDFGDNYSRARDILNPLQLFPQPVNALDPDVTMFRVEDDKGNMCSVEQPVQILRSFNVGCSAEFDARLLENGKIELTARAEGMQPFNIRWSTGDTSRVIQVEAKDATYSLRIKANNACESILERTITIRNGAVDYIGAKFGYKIFKPDGERVNPIINGSRFQFGKVGIFYTDENGSQYRSDLKPQTKNRYFEVVKVEEYEKNENQQPTKKLTVKYDCDLFGPNGEKIRLTGEGVIAVAHP